MTETKRFLITRPNVALTKSLKQNVKSLMDNNVELFIRKDELSKKSLVCFEAVLFNSDIRIIVKMPKGFLAKSWYSRNTIIIDFQDELSNEFVAKVQDELIKNLGVPDDCNASADTCYYNVDSFQLVHSVEEVRYGYVQHRLFIDFNPKRHLKTNDNFDKINDMRNFILSCTLDKNMLITHMTYNELQNVSLHFLLEDKQKGYYCRGIRGEIKITPFTINSFVDENGINNVSHNPVTEKSITKRYSTRDDIKRILCEFFDEN